MGKLKKYKILGGILSALSILFVGLAIYAIYLFTGIETFYRIMFGLLLTIGLITCIYSLLDSVKFFKKKKFIISSICTGLLIIFGLIIALVLFTIYLKLSGLNSSDSTYKTALISLSTQNEVNNLKDIKIGMIKDEEDIEGYILPKEVIDKYNLNSNNEIIEYNDTLTLMSALLNNEVDAIFISATYNSKFKNIEGFDTNTEIFEIATYSKNIKKTDTKTDNSTNTAKVTEPFTILLLGVDTDEESFNADTIMMITFDPETLHATMFSIPRDTYTTICSGSQTKITHAGWGGTKCVVKTVESFTGIKVDYYVRINFRGVIDLVNAIGGITVDVPMDFCESNEDRLIGPDYEICLKKGVQTINGQQALALARHRKTLPLGDFQRGQNQQLVVEGMINQIKTLRSVSDFYNVLDIVSNNLDTSMSVDEMLSFYNIGKSLLTKDEDVSINITKTFLTGYDLYVYEGYSSMYTFQYYEQSLDSIVNAMKVNLGLLEQEEIKEFSFSIKEPYEKTIIGYKYYSEARKTLIPDFTTYSIDGAKAWGSARGLTITTEEVEVSGGSYYNGQIISQSVHEGILLEKSPKTIVLQVAKVVEGGNITTPEPDPSEENNKPDPIIPGIPTEPEEPTNPDGPSDPTGGEEGGNEEGSGNDLEEE